MNSLENIQLTSGELFSRRTFFSTAGVAMALMTIPSLNSAAKISSEKPYSPKDNERKLLLGMVIFDGFRILDVFGPLDMFGALKDKVTIVLISEKIGAVKSSAGPAVNTNYTFANVPKLDILMIPGGPGTRREVNNSAFINNLLSVADITPNVAAICTGSAVLAKTGLIDARKATTNKLAYKWATSQSEKVIWIPQARWVEDGKYFTSSGVSAGIDMALALIAKIFGQAEAVKVANAAEYEWKNDANDDPFAKLNGLVP